jgi:ribosome-binding factor A
MSVDRLDRINALLRREIGEACFHVLAGVSIDLSAVTVTRVEAARNLRTAVVYVSIRGHEAERGRILRRIAGRHADFQRLINRDLKMKYTPVLQFRLDTSVEKGDHVLDVLLQMEHEAAPDAAPDAEEEPV